MKRSRLSLAITVILTLIALIYLYPLFLIVINSLKTFAEITINAVALPQSPQFSNYVETFRIDEVSQSLYEHPHCNRCRCFRGRACLLDGWI